MADLEWTADEGCITESGNLLLGIQDGRTFTKVNPGKAIAVASYNTSIGLWTTRIISPDQNAVVYEALNRRFSHLGSVTYLGTTWYYSHYEYFEYNAPIVDGFITKRFEGAYNRDFDSENLAILQLVNVRLLEEHHEYLNQEGLSYAFGLVKGEMIGVDETKVLEVEGEMVAALPFRFGIDENNNYGYYKKVEGADTFVPFKSGGGASDFTSLGLISVIDIVSDSRISLSDNGKPWSYKSTYTCGNVQAYTSYAISDSQVTTETIVFTPTSSGTLMLLYTCTSEDPHDYMTIVVNGTTVESKYSVGRTTEYTWKNYIIDVVGDSAITIVLSYTKDSSVAAGYDSAGIILLEVGD